MHASWKTNLKVIYSIFGLFDQVILLKKDWITLSLAIADTIQKNNSVPKQGH